MNPFFAYLDPGSGSLILQALVGGFSGMVVLGRYLWIQCVARKPIQPAVQSSADIPVRLG
jgi:hypothetical protein